MGLNAKQIMKMKNSYTALYLRKKRSENKGWLGYYQQMLSDDKFTYYTENIGSETVSGLFNTKG